MNARARLALIDDIPLLVQLMAEFYAEAGLSLDRQWSAASFEALMGNPDFGTVWLLLDGQTEAGYLVLTVRFGMEFGGLEAFVDDLFVRPGSRRRGLGSAALDAFFADCAGRNVRAAHVIAGVGNGAGRALYDRYGFRPLSDRRVTLTRVL